MEKQQYGLARMVVLFLLLSSVMLATQTVPSAAQVIIADPQDPWFGQKLPPQPYKGYYKFLGDCIDKLTKKCGREMSNYVFHNIGISLPCCGKLKEMGQLCSKSLSYTLAHIDKFKSLAPHIIQKSDEAYDKCVKVAS